MTRRGPLLKLAAVILAASAVLAWFVAELGPRAAVDRAAWLYVNDGLAAAEEHLAQHLRAHPGDEEAWRLLVQQRAHARLPAGLTDGLRAPEASDQIVAQLKLMERQGQPFLDEAAFLALLEVATSPPPEVLRVIYQRGGGLAQGAALDELRSLPGPAPLREAALLLVRQMQVERALNVADEALARGPDEQAAGLALTLLLQQRQYDEVERRLEQPVYREAFAADHRLDLALGRHDLGGVALGTLGVRFGELDLPVHTAALVAGAAWMVFLLLLGGARSWKRRDQAAAALALVAGFASGVLTLMAAIILDESLQVEQRGHDEMFSLAFFVLGVGFKEEALKLLCFLPLIPLIKNTSQHLVILIVASMVGLGFAIEENTGYFTMGGDVVLGRFLTANFLHLTLTGIAGYYLTLAVKNGGEAWNTFTLEFFKVVAIHGLYDYLLTTTIFEGASFFAMIAFVVISQIYLRLVLRLPRPERAKPGRLLTAFVVCLSAAFGTNLILLASRYGFVPALDQMVVGALANALIAYMFFRELE